MSQALAFLVKKHGCKAIKIASKGKGKWATLKIVIKVVRMMVGIQMKIWNVPKFTLPLRIFGVVLGFLFLVTGTVAFYKPLNEAWYLGIITLVEGVIIIFLELPLPELAFLPCLFEWFWKHFYLRGFLYLLFSIHLFFMLPVGFLAAILVIILGIAYVVAWVKNEGGSKKMSPKDLRKMDCISDSLGGM